MAAPALRLKRPVPQRATNAAVHLPAPTGGINAADPASAMPPTDCLSLYNLIPYQYGLRVRSGWREWCTNVGTDLAGLGFYDDGSPMMFHLAAPLGGAVVGAWPGISRDGVRTIISFYGKNEAGDRLFACTAYGIYDCTKSTDAPTLVYTYPIGPTLDQYGNVVNPPGAGVMSYTSFVNANSDHFIAACDGANGYLLYSEATDAWTKVTQGSGTGQINATNANGGNVPDPSTFRFVMAWKNRLWFIPDNSSTAYYLPVNVYAGQINPIYMGSRFRYGGALVGLYSWTGDGGIGVDDHLVGISRGGDVVVYKGTDPAFAETFGLVGVWWVGQIPPGRNIATDFGGDLFILARLGCLPMSKLVNGVPTADPNTYVTAKVNNLFNKFMTERGHLDGWAVKMNPADNLLVINIPATPDKVQEQLVMSLANKGWAEQIGVPMMCMETYKGNIYFGTEDSRVCVHDGYTDGAALDGTGAYAIDCSILTAYSSLGSAMKKRVHMIKPYFSTDGTPPGYQVQARYDFDLAQIGVVPTTPTPPTSSWGTGKWGAPNGLQVTTNFQSAPVPWTNLTRVAVTASSNAKWGRGTGTEAKLKGTTGIGTSVAFILRVTTKTNTTLVGFDAVLDSGGIR
jgi:hypothetical protein